MRFDLPLRKHLRALSAPRLAVILVSLITIVLGGCSLLLSTDADQCMTDADCSGRGGALAGYLCSAEHVCVSPSSLADGSTVDGGGCSKDSCCSNTQCSADLSGHPALCRKPGDACIDMLGGDLCSHVDGPYTDPNAVFMGLLVQFSDIDPVNRDLSDIAYKITKLAVDEFNGSGTGLPPLSTGQPRRPVVLVSCDSAPSNPERSQAAAEHIVKTIGAGAIVGPVDEGAGISLASQTILPNGAFLACPYCTSEQYTALNAAGSPTLFSTNPTSKSVGPALARAVADVEADVRAAYGLASDLKLALIFNGNVPQYDEASRVLQADPGFIWNGKSRADNDAAGNYKLYKYQGGNFLTLLADLAAYDPQIVVMVGGLEVPLTGVPLIENQLGDSKVVRPYYLAHDGSYSTFAAEFLGGGQGSKFRKRFRGLWPSKRGALLTRYNDFVSRFKSEFPTQDPSGYEAFYDATYLTLMGMEAHGQAAQNGANITKGITRLQPPGVQFQTSPNDILSMFAALQTPSTTLDLEGTLTPLDYDMTNGTLKPVEYTYWCSTFTSGGRPEDAGVVDSGTADAEAGISDAGAPSDSGASVGDASARLSLKTGRYYVPGASSWTGTPYWCP